MNFKCERVFDNIKIMGSFGDLYSPMYDAISVYVVYSLNHHFKQGSRPVLAQPLTTFTNSTVYKVKEISVATIFHHNIVTVSRSKLFKYTNLQTNKYSRLGATRIHGPGRGLNPGPLAL